MTLRLYPVIYGAVFGVLLAVCGLRWVKWRFWVLLVGYAVLSSVEKQVGQ